MKGKVEKMNEKKTTKKEYFNQLLEIVKGNNELTDFITHEIELLERKATRKSLTSNQVANNNIKDVIIATLKELAKPSTITDIQNANTELAELSNQKISALLTQLINSNLVIRVVEKKKAYFSIAE